MRFVSQRQPDLRLPWDPLRLRRIPPAAEAFEHFIHAIQHTARPAADDEQAAVARLQVERLRPKFQIGNIDPGRAGGVLVTDVNFGPATAHTGLGAGHQAEMPTEFFSSVLDSWQSIGRQMDINVRHSTGR